MEVFKVALVSILIFFLLPEPTVSVHNITAILSNSPGFGTFNHYLTITNLATEINNRETITVLAVNEFGMKDLVTKHLDIFTIKNILSLHVLLDYFDVKKLRQLNNGTELTTTLFRATGTATNSSGFVNITDLSGGVIGFGTEDSGKTDSRYVTSLTEIPYNISVIQISNILPTPESVTPSPDPASVNITDMMCRFKCKSFSDALIKFSAVKAYEDNINSGLTIFCPEDYVFLQFMPKFENLSDSEKKSLLEYHGLPIFQSYVTLNTSNSLTNTLATTGANYDFTVENNGENVVLKIGVVKATIVTTLIDQNPLGVFMIDNVLLPKDLFKGDGSWAPAMAPEGSKKKPKSTPAPVEEPADSPSGESGDVADSNNAVQIEGFTFTVLALVLWFVLLK